jgi:peptidoglycan/xylan/chitin deacetylase (PgdA/CDA1 family)
MNKQHHAGAHTYSKHYPWIEFSLCINSRRVQSEIRRCTRCGAEETEETAPRSLHYGSWGVLGTEAFIVAHYRCKEKER